MIQEALDALPETEESDLKCSSFTSNPELLNGDLTGSTSTSHSNLGCSVIDLALCQLADDEFSTFWKRISCQQK